MSASPRPWPGSGSFPSRTPVPSFSLPLFTEVRGRGILRTSRSRSSEKLVLRECLLTRKGPREYVLYAYAVRQTKCVLYEYAYRQTRTRKDCSNMVPGRDKRQEPG